MSPRLSLNKLRTRGRGPTPVALSEALVLAIARVSNSRLGRTFGFQESYHKTHKNAMPCAGCGISLRSHLGQSIKISSSIQTSIRRYFI